MFAPLDETKAVFFAEALIRQFDENGVDSVLGSEKSGQKCSEFAKESERSNGMMFGILVAEDKDGKEIVLKAFSGQYKSKWIIEGWVPPLLDTEEFYKLTEESDRQIHLISDGIEKLEKEKASEYAIKKLEDLKAERKAASKKSMQEIFALYRIPVIAGFKTVETVRTENPKNGKIIEKYRLCPVIEERSIFDFFEKKSSKKEKVLPPTGTGECCAPKLLGYALKNGLTPVSMTEFFYGESSPAATRLHKHFYPPCDEKCSPLLPSMLGIKIIYKDKNLVVVEKPSGLLSVPGRGPEKQDCVVNRVKYLFKTLMTIEQPAVHRLDMETSGLMVLAFDVETHRKLNRQFEDGLVFKQYIAVLERIPEEIKSGRTKGTIELPFRLDVENRPHQIYDEVYGKTGITEWEFIRGEKGGKSGETRCRMLYTPKTGRTHQLRLHSADTHGFGVPICGDELYGSGKKSAERLLLHAAKLEFTHPVTGERLKFFSEPEF